jgi:hypothetical protein
MTIINDSMAELTWEISDRMIYNDIRAEIDIRYSNEIVDDPGETASKLASVITGLGIGETKDITITSPNRTTSWGNPYATEARYDIYGGTASACQLLGGTFWEWSGDPSRNHCLLQLTAQIFISVLETTETTMTVRLVNNSGYNIMQGNLVIAVRYDYISRPVRTHIDSGVETLQIRTFDDISIRKYGRRVLPINWPLGQSQSQMQALIDGYLSRYKDPVSTVEMTLRGRDAANIAIILGGRITDRITVVNSALSLSKDYFINTKNFQDSAFTPDFPSMIYALEEARDSEGNSLFTLDTSELDGAHILGY